MGSGLWSRRASARVRAHSIAAVRGVDPKTLRKHYREALDLGPGGLDVFQVDAQTAKRRADTDRGRMLSFEEGEAIIDARVPERTVHRHRELFRSS
jgi:hypothetical protein